MRLVCKKPHKQPLHPHHEHQICSRSVLSSFPCLFFSRCSSQTRLNMLEKYSRDGRTLSGESCKFPDKRVRRWNAREGVSVCLCAVEVACVVSLVWKRECVAKLPRSLMQLNELITEVLGHKRQAHDLFASINIPILTDQLISISQASSATSVPSDLYRWLQCSYERSENIKQITTSACYTL